MRVAAKRLSRYAGHLGLLGVSIVLASSLVTAINYEGSKGKPYSPFNHFVSELGQLRVSSCAPIFNGGLMLGGLSLIIFMIGLGNGFVSKLGFAVMIAGTVAAIACVMVGLFPMKNLKTHVPAALTFFYGRMITIFLCLNRQCGSPLRTCSVLT